MKNGENLAKLLQWCCDAEINVSVSFNHLDRDLIEMRFHHHKTNRQKNMHFRGWDHLEHTLHNQLLHLFAELVAPVPPGELKGNAGKWVTKDEVARASDYLDAVRYVQGMRVSYNQALGLPEYISGPADSSSSPSIPKKK